MRSPLLSPRVSRVVLAVVSGALAIGLVLRARSAAGLVAAGTAGQGTAGQGAGGEGAGVRVSGREVRAEADGLRLEAFTWAARGAEGPGWLVSAARATARVSVAPSDGVRPLPAFVTPPGPTWAAVNGGFYEDGPMGLVVHGGAELHALSPRGGSGVLTVGPDGVGIVHRDAWRPGASEALQSIDRLVDGGAPLVGAKASAHRDARSAVAVSADRVWLVVTAARESVGPDVEHAALTRTAGHGMTLAELAGFLATEVGAEAALNLDGAVSTQLVAHVGDTSVEWVGERGTVNAVVLAP